jgi:hypothetical protein
MLITLVLNRKYLTMRLLLTTILGLFLVLFVTSCYYDSEEFLFPKINTQCDTLNITFTNSVSPILDNSCLTCHANSVAASSGGNIKLENYADVKVQADNHKLLGSVAHENGYSPMPLGTAKLEDCKISIIRIWVNTGALNN